MLLPLTRNACRTLPIVTTVTIPIPRLSTCANAHLKGIFKLTRLESILNADSNPQGAKLHAGSQSVKACV